MVKGFLGLAVCVIAYLRKGFLGDTKPVLDKLVIDGPYRFCRHPLYLSFFVLLFGIDLMFGSPVGVAFTVTLSVPSAVCRAKVEDDLLKERFGREWEEYADRVGFMIPRF